MSLVHVDEVVFTRLIIFTVINASMRANKEGEKEDGEVPPALKAPDFEGRIDMKQSSLQNAATKAWVRNSL